MKLKFLSLFLTFSIFAFGMNMGAQAVGEPSEPSMHADTMKDSAVDAPASPAEEKAMLRDAAGTLVCNVLGKVIPDQTKWPQMCQDVCANDPKIADLLPCVQAIMQDNGQPLYAKVISGIKSACKGGTCGQVTCKVPVVRKACGYVCCNIDQSTVTNCMTKNGDNCINYKK